MKKIVSLMFGLCLLTSQTYAGCQSNAIPSTPNDRYAIINSGVEVLDNQTKLIWQRCSLGQIWNGGECSGIAATYSWKNALIQTKALGGNYRLPNIKELQSLREVACTNPAINSVIFPNTVSDAYWSGSPSKYYYNDAWTIDFKTGNSYALSRSFNYSHYVRLVRSGQ
jgi:hypothetical protein